MYADSAKRLGPPLRVHHLLAWTAASVLVGVWQVGIRSLAKQSFPDVVAAHDTIQNTILDAVSMVANGGMLALSAYGIVWKIRDRPAFWQPGMWLAVFGTIKFVLIVVSVAIQWGWGWTEQRLLVGIGVELIARAFCLSAFLVLIFRRGLTASWRAVCGVFAFDQLIATLSPAILLFEEFNGDSASMPGWVWTALSSVPETSSFIAVFAIGTACAVDLIKRRRMQWPHWAGASLWLAGRLIDLPW